MGGNRRELALVLAPGPVPAQSGCHSSARRQASWLERQETALRLSSVLASFRRVGCGCAGPHQIWATSNCDAIFLPNMSLTACRINIPSHPHSTRYLGRYLLYST